MKSFLPQATRRASLLTGFTIGALVVTTALGVQHARHGWPFSLHHAPEPDAGPPIDHASASAASQDAGQPQPRTAVKLDDRQHEYIGVRIERVRREPLTLPLRAVATVVPDESRVTHVHARVAGWLEELHINTTGQQVRAGEPVAAVFSQDLLATQIEYLAARKDAGSGPPSVVAEGAHTRLKLLGMSDTEIAAIERDGKPRRLVTLTAPHGGVVLRRGVSAGTAIDPSTEILTVADLSTVWVLAEIPEHAAAQLNVGTRALLEFPALGGEPVPAQVNFLYPTLSERTRTLRARFSVPNPDGRLRPGIYGTAVLAGAPREALLIPRDAVVDTGLGQHVFVAAGDGSYEPRSVRLGARLADRVEVLDGLAEGEPVVTSGVFLLDSESRLRASGSASPHADHGKSP